MIIRAGITEFPWKRKYLAQEKKKPSSFVRTFTDNFRRDLLVKKDYNDYLQQRQQKKIVSISMYLVFSQVLYIDERLLGAMVKATE